MVACHTRLVRVLVLVPYTAIRTARRAAEATAEEEEAAEEQAAAEEEELLLGFI